MSNVEKETSGVQELIDRLHNEGLAKGKEESEQLLSEARLRASQILDEAKREADELSKKASADAKRTRAAGEEAVRVAGRDAILVLTEELRKDFVQKLNQLVGQHLRDPEFLKRMILEIAGNAVPTEGPLNMRLLAEEGRAAVGDASENAELDDFVRGLSAEALRDGLTFEVAESDVPGVRIQATDTDLEIDLDAQTITHLLVKQLSPRFRAIVEEG